MGKKSSGSEVRSSSSAKAGKRHGTITYPAPLSSERRAAKEAGEQQFRAQSTLTVEREATIIVYDKAAKLFAYRTKKTTVPTEHNWDPTRKRVITSPKPKDKKKK